MADRIDVHVDNAAISRMFSGAGEVGHWGGRVSSKARLNARILAPKRTNDLADSIQNYSNQVYTYGLRIALYSDLYYAKWVEEGTRDEIVGKTGRGMWVPKIKGTSYPREWRKKVHGQRGQAFMKRGLQEALMSEGIWVEMMTML